MVLGVGYLEGSCAHYAKHSIAVHVRSSIAKRIFYRGLGPLSYMTYKWRTFRKYRNIESIGSTIPRIMIIFIHASSNGDNLIMRVVDRCSAFDNKVEPDCFQRSLTSLEYSLNLGRRSPGLSLLYHSLP
jgi:hypothetical protein